jgi:hypothetical protein
VGAARRRGGRMQERDLQLGGDRLEEGGGHGGSP